MSQRGTKVQSKKSNLHKPSNQPNKNTNIQQQNKVNERPNVSLRQLSNDPIIAQMQKEESYRIIEEMVGSTQSESLSYSISDEEIQSAKNQENNDAYLLVNYMYERFVAPTVMCESEEQAAAQLRTMFMDYYSNPKMQNVRNQIESNEKYSKIMDTIHKFVTTMGNDKFDVQYRVSMTNELLNSLKNMSC